jgi:hypothetical protein
VSDLCSYDAAAYALGALDPSEIEAFRAHLDDCAVCRDELVAFEHVAGVLPLAVKQVKPPGRLRRRVLAGARADIRMRTTRPLSWGVLARARAATAVACAAALTTAGVVALNSSGGTSGARDYTARVLAPGASAYLQVAHGRARLVVNHFPPAKRGHVYEVWLQRSATAAPEPTRALFSVDAAGDAAVPVPGDAAHLHRVLVTQEPAGGTAVPTTAPVIVATL